MCLARNARFRTIDFSTAMLECHPLEHSNGSSSAEKPVLTERRVRLCARAENTRVKKCRKTACAVDDTTKIAFISCGLHFVMVFEDDCARLQKIVTEMFNLGCLMFALSFEQLSCSHSCLHSVKRQLQDTLSAGAGCWMLATAAVAATDGAVAVDEDPEHAKVPSVFCTTVFVAFRVFFPCIQAMTTNASSHSKSAAQPVGSD